MSPYFHRHSAAVELACIFRPSDGLRGACTTIAEFSHMRLPFPSKFTAVRLMVERNMESNETGSGNRAKRRADKLSQ